ncbi:NAD-dependent epimerase/dehydratase family protein [Mesorhizobium sp. VNQ89]|uniref:NAD-dependent epimerase/dehydratase family protein n=1 Tax=Mesorhizobium quangtriensis TaxID=3157709 RepID=UPI0032B7A2BE
MRFLVTGTAGFIGFHLARRLLAEGHSVVGYDGMTPYYDVDLKRRRHEILGAKPDFAAVEAMLEDAPALRAAADKASPDVVVHLAAQAGVRYSLEQPHSYASSNLTGMLNMLEVCRAVQPKHFLFASTSSVYGMSDKPEFAETDPTDRPVSLYAATKKGGEVMAHSYAHLFNIPTTVCRFFTVYGPYGRPDMSLYKFVRAIVSDRPIDVFGRGEHERDFTYVDDLVESVTRLVDCVPQVGKPVTGATDTLSAVAPYREVNIAGGKTVGLMRYIETIEKILGKKAILNLLPIQQGDVLRTAGSPALLHALTGYRPATDIEVGLRHFIDWYLADVQAPAKP